MAYLWVLLLLLSPSEPVEALYDATPQEWSALRYWAEQLELAGSWECLPGDFNQALRMLWAYQQACRGLPHLDELYHLPRYEEAFRKEEIATAYMATLQRQADSNPSRKAEYARAIAIVDRRREIWQLFRQAADPAMGWYWKRTWIGKVKAALGDRNFHNNLWPNPIPMELLQEVP